jgi:hypothetical protein
MPDVTAAGTAGEASVLPGMVEVVVGVVAPVSWPIHLPLL